jgi:hypothetical protein
VSLGCLQACNVCMFGAKAQNKGRWRLWGCLKEIPRVLATFTSCGPPFLTQAEKVSFTTKFKKTSSHSWVQVACACNPSY